MLDELRRKIQHQLDEVVRGKSGYRSASEEQRIIHDLGSAHFPLALR